MISHSKMKINNMLRIKKKILQKLDNEDMRHKLSKGTGRSASAAYRWVKEGHVMLTTADSLKVIREELKLTDSQILEETKKLSA